MISEIIVGFAPSLKIESLKIYEQGGNRNHRRVGVL